MPKVPDEVQTMTRSLQRAFEIAARLSESEQDQLAATILAEIEADERFERALLESPAALERLADEALAEHRAGRTRLADADQH